MQTRVGGALDRIHVIIGCVILWFSIELKARTTMLCIVHIGMKYELDFFLVPEIYYNM